MTRQKIIFIFCCLLFSLLLLPLTQTNGGPVVIRDDRVRDLGYTPALGRGYSVATGTYQSICLKNIVRTKPSYNFRYSFEQLEKDGKRSADVSVGTRGSYSRGLWGFKISVSGRQKTRVRDSKTYHKQHLLVTVFIDQYYSSVNEAQTYLADSARELLTNRDLPGFFASCGVYSIRSIRRFSKYESMFSYETETNKRDVEFEAELEIALRSFFHNANLSVDVSTKVSQEASKKRLIIRSTAFGMGKDRNASLIAYDIETYKKAIRSAFLSMQDEQVGLVDSIEIVPWVENIDFQKNVALLVKKTTQETDTNQTATPPAAQAGNNAGGDAGTATTAPATKKEKGKEKEYLDYEGKQILTQNGEFLAEVDRSARNRLNIYYKAKLCRRRIDRDYKEGGIGGGQIKEQYTNSKVVNHRAPGKTITLDDLDKNVVSKKVVDEYLKSYNKFMYEDSVACVKELFKSDITKTCHTDVSQCQQLETQLAEIIGRNIDDYCMPATE